MLSRQVLGLRTFSSAWCKQHVLVPSLSSLSGSKLVSIRPLSSKKMATTLSADEVARYSRQLILPEIGVEGQKKLKSSSVLIVGCGGLGCPSSLYLTAAGFGKIGLVDADVVETSNLHRQVLHREDTVGIPKTTSAEKELLALNSNVSFEKFSTRLTKSNALDIIRNFDIVIDATDNVIARYLISDACVLTGKPLVSGSALRFDGQLTVYNFDQNSPCYRCLFPTPPPPGTVTNCSDGGVIGVVPGIIGTLQAMEAIKIAVGMRPSYAGTMLLYDGLEGRFRNIKIRSKRSDCIACSDKRTLDHHLMDYEAFCGQQTCAPQGLKILLPFERVQVTEYKREVLDAKVDHVLIDVRPKVEQDIVKLPHSVTIPLQELTKNTEGLKFVEDQLQKKKPVYVMCRKGNASQKAVRFLKDNLTVVDPSDIKDLEGGLEAWIKEVDQSLPVY